MVKIITDKKFDNIDCIKYGFFTRLDGFSKDEFESLNFNSSDAFGEDKIHVLKNLNVVKDFFNSPNNVFKMRQIHSNKVFVLDDLKYLTDIDKIEADAVVTKLKNVVIGVTTADCVPILIVDDVKKIIGVIHAGWKSAITGIIKNTISEMKNLGADVKNIKAVVGPHLRVDNFEIKKDFLDNLVKNNINYSDFIINKNDKIYFDISKFINFDLKNNGIINFSDVEIDTYSNPELFFSYRRSFHENKNKFGCQFSAIMLKK